MQDDRTGTASSDAPAPEVSPDNPCPFLRAVVSEGFVGGHVVPLAHAGQHRGGGLRQDGLSEESWSA